MAWHRKSRWALTAIAVAALASGCSGGGGSRADAAPEVVTLASKGGTPSASASVASRPRERLDTTPEEFEIMIKPFEKCLHDHGAKTKSDMAAEGRQFTKAEIQKLEEANKICEPLYYPLPPWEKDPANPEAKDFSRDVVACLKGKGVKYVEVGDNGVDIELGGAQNDSRSISKGLDLMPDCEREVAARKK